MTETNAELENRFRATMKERPRRARRSSPISPPSQIEPAAMCDQSSRSAAQRGDVCAAWPAAPGTMMAAPAASSAPHDAKRAATERRPGRSTQIAAAPARANSASSSSSRRYPRPNEETSISGTSAPNDQNDLSANCAVASST